MSKTIGTLEKEMLMWKGRYEKCNKSLLDMAQEVCTITMATLTRGGALNGVCDVSARTHTHTQRMVMEQNAQLLRTKNEKLEKLCRALQAERNQLRKQEKTVRPVAALSVHASSSLSLSLSPLPQQEGGDSREEPREKDKASEDAVEEETSDGAVQLGAAVNDGGGGGGGGGDRSDQSSPLPSSDKAEAKESSSSEIENKKEH